MISVKSKNNNHRAFNFVLFSHITITELSLTLRPLLGANKFSPVKSRTLVLIVRTCVPLMSSAVFFLLEGAVIRFFFLLFSVFVSSTTGEVYICRSVFDNCVVHLGVIFLKGIVKSNAKGVIFVSLFLIVFS